MSGRNHMSIAGIWKVDGVDQGLPPEHACVVKGTVHRVRPRSCPSGSQVRMDVVDDSHHVIENALAPQRVIQVSFGQAQESVGQSNALNRATGQVVAWLRTARRASA